jgi:hypothetical protein
MAKRIKLKFEGDGGALWQLYRSREQFRAVEIDYPFELGGEKGDAGDFVAYDPLNGYRVLKADAVKAFQPIADSERAKV